MTTTEQQYATKEELDSLAQVVRRDIASLTESVRDGFRQVRGDFREVRGDIRRVEAKIDKMDKVLNALAKAHDIDVDSL